MAEPNKFERFERLETEVLNLLEQGAPYASIANQLNTMSAIVASIGGSEHNGMRVMPPAEFQAWCDRIRLRIGMDNGAGKLRSVRVTHRTPRCGVSPFDRDTACTGEAW